MDSFPFCSTNSFYFSNRQESEDSSQQRSQEFAEEFRRRVHISVDSEGRQSSEDTLNQVIFLCFLMFICFNV